MDLRVPPAARFSDALRPVFLSPGAVGMLLDAGAVEAQHLDAPVDQMQVPQRSEQPVEYAHLGPAAQPGRDHFPFAEVLKQGAPFAAVLGNAEKRVDEDDVRNPHISALYRQIGMDFRAMFFRDLFHDRALLVCYLFLYKYLA